MIHSDMNLSRLMLYVQSFEESKLGRRGWDSKRGITDEHGQPRFKKRAPNKVVPSAPKVNYERDGGSHIDNPTCSNYWKKYFGKCLACTSGFYGCGKDAHKVRDFPTITSKVRKAKKIPYGGLNVGEPNKIVSIYSNLIRKKKSMKVLVSYSSYFCVTLNKVYWVSSQLGEYGSYLV